MINSAYQLGPTWSWHSRQREGRRLYMRVPSMTAPEAIFVVDRLTVVVTWLTAAAIHTAVINSLIKNNVSKYFRLFNKKTKFIILIISTHNEAA